MVKFFLSSVESMANNKFQLCATNKYKTNENKQQQQAEKMSVVHCILIIMAVPRSNNIRRPNRIE